MWRRRSIYLELRLAADLVHWCLVGEFSDELVRLYVDVLLAWWRLRRFNIAREKLLRGFRSLLLKALRVVFALICLEELIRVGSSRDHHGSVGAAAEHSLVEHDVLRVVLIATGATIRILILLFLGNDARVSRKALPARSATSTGLLKHFLNFI